MASHVVVIAADLRRATVKVAPATYLVDVLHEACAKLGLSSDRFLLKHKQKQVDLAVPWRAAGLLPGAKLELVVKSKTPAPVQIALQLPQPDARDVPGGRLVAKFPSDMTLWHVLRQFESGDAAAGRNINITARGVAPAGAPAGARQLYYETPVLNIMGRELATFDHFQKTLSQLGHNSGSVLVRLSFRTTDQTLFDAMEHISRFFSDAAQPRQEAAAAGTNDAAPSHAADPVTAGAEAPPPPDAAAQPPPPSPPAQQQQPAPAAPSSPPPPPTGQSPPQAPTPGSDAYQPVSVFLAPTGSVPAAALRAPAAESEADFTPSIAHAQLHQARLHESARNRRLPSDAELAGRAAAEAARLDAITSVLVRVRFPDNTSGEWSVGPAHTGAFLYAAVRAVMAAPQLPFRLVVSGAKTPIRDDADPRHSLLIRGYKLAGRVLVNLVWHDDVAASARRQPFLRPEMAQRAQAIKPPPDVSNTVDDDDDDDDAAAASAGRAPPPQQPRADTGDAAKKTPKWFKFGKK